MLQETTENTEKPSAYKVEIKDENTAAPLNYAATVIFILAFIWFLYLVKRKVSKYVSFYLLRKDYERMRLIVKEENLNVPSMEVLKGLAELNEEPEFLFHHKSAKGEDGVPNVPPGTPQSPYIAPISVNRSMTRMEISQEYKKTIFTNITVYHPVMSIIPARFSWYCLKNTLRLPYAINGSLTLAWLLISLTLSLALSNLGENSNLCSDARTNARYFICRES